MVIYTAAIKAIISIEISLSISKPKTAVPNAVEKTMRAVVNAFMLPMCFTPYISAQVDVPRTFAKALETPIKPKNIYAESEWLKKNKTNMDTSNGTFIKGINFLLEKRSTKKPEEKSVIIDTIEYTINALGIV